LISIVEKMSSLRVDEGSAHLHRRWTEEDKDKVQQLYRQYEAERVGSVSAKLAQVLGRSETAVNKKLYQLDRKNKILTDLQESQQGHVGLSASLAKLAPSF
jgi:hypothetical protein